jgi:hypothetical protein
MPLKGSSYHLVCARGVPYHLVYAPGTPALPRLCPNVRALTPRYEFTQGLCIHAAVWNLHRGPCIHALGGGYRTPATPTPHRLRPGSSHTTLFAPPGASVPPRLCPGMARTLPYHLDSAPGTPVQPRLHPGAPVPPRLHPVPLRFCPRGSSRTTSLAPPGLPRHLVCALGAPMPPRVRSRGSRTTSFAPRGLPYHLVCAPWGSHTTSFASRRLPSLPPRFRHSRSRTTMFAPPNGSRTTSFAPRWLPYNFVCSSEAPVPPRLCP